MWELDYKESWTPKNWCFWTVVLEKTLECPLESNEIQTVHLKDQSWVVIGWTDAEAENSSTLATWCEELTHLKRPWWWERLNGGGEWDDTGWDGWIVITESSKLQELVMDREAWPCCSPWGHRVGHDWMTELNWIPWVVLHSAGLTE